MDRRKGTAPPDRGEPDVASVPPPPPPPPPAGDAQPSAVFRPMYSLGGGGCTLIIWMIVLIAGITASLSVRYSGRSRRHVRTRPDPAVVEVARPLFSTLTRSAVAWNPPLQMRQGLTYPVECRIALDQRRVTLDRMLGSTDVQRWDLDLTPVVRVNMTSSPEDAFTIKLHTDTEQYLTRDGYVRWVWDLKPLRSGDFSLFLNISIVDVDPNGKERGRVIPLDPRVVHVEVAPSYVAMEFIRRNWGVLLTSIAIPLVIAGFAWLRSRARRKTKAAGFLQQ